MFSEEVQILLLSHAVGNNEQICAWSKQSTTQKCVSFFFSPRECSGKWLFSVIYFLNKISPADNTFDRSSTLLLLLVQNTEFFPQLNRLRGYMNASRGSASQRHVSIVNRKREEASLEMLLILQTFASFSPLRTQCLR